MNQPDFAITVDKKGRRPRESLIIDTDSKRREYLRVHDASKHEIHRMNFEPRADNRGGLVRDDNACDRLTLELTPPFIQPTHMCLTEWTPGTLDEI
jgi:hypothetical protein